MPKDSDSICQSANESQRYQFFAFGSTQMLVS